MNKNKDIEPKNRLVVFQNRQIRRIWHEDEWYYSVVDICGVLTDSADSGAYWRKLKQRLKQGGSEQPVAQIRFLWFCCRVKWCQGLTCFQIKTLLSKILNHIDLSFPRKGQNKLNEKVYNK